MSFVLRSSSCVPKPATFPPSITIILSASRTDAIRCAIIILVVFGISSFPDGYNTDLSQGGSNVSGGQKQRLSIARAILKKPKILILDDSTSAVDTFTDSKIRKGLRECIPDTTKIIIAQRISSVEYCDKIIILENGGINDIGTHNELLERNEIYKDIYESQQKGSDDFDLQGGGN